MSDNTALWDNLGRTDPAHVKSFQRAGGFKGTAIKPMWSYRRMTEEFGPCGQGWGVGEPSFQVVPGPEGEQLVYCTTSIWYGEEHKTVYGVGGDKAVGKNKYGLTADDEAFKKAFTDAITNALKMIGVGADVHMGMFDDSKYVNSMEQEFGGKNGNGTTELSKKDARPVFESLQNDMRQIQTRADLRRWWKDEDVHALRQKIPADWDKLLKDEMVKHSGDLPETEAEDVFPGDQANGEDLSQHPINAG